MSASSTIVLLRAVCDAVTAPLRAFVSTDTTLGKALACGSHHPHAGEPPLASAVVTHLIGVLGISVAVLVATVSVAQVVAAVLTDNRQPAVPGIGGASSFAAMCSRTLAGRFVGALRKFVTMRVLRKRTGNPGRRDAHGDVLMGGPKDYDVIIIGASIAGPPLAKLLFEQGRRVLVIERSWDKPNRIVGELMQPGGIAVLKEMGLEHCARSVGSLCTGYVTRLGTRWVGLPFEKGVTSVSFHFGDFVMALRRVIVDIARTCRGRPAGSTSPASVEPQSKPRRGVIDVVEGTVLAVTYEDEGTSDPAPFRRRITGVRYRVANTKLSPAYVIDRTFNRAVSAARNDGTDEDGAAAVGDEETTVLTASAHLVAFCDGHGSFLRFEPPSYIHSYFVGIILRDVKLPLETRGHVILAKSGPVLLYRLDPHEVRVLIDYHQTPKLPGQEALRAWILSEIVPDMPVELHAAFVTAVTQQTLRSMPHHQFKPFFPVHYGHVGLGDHANQRHPLTGGGMTCALRDVYYFAKEIEEIESLADNDAVHAAVQSYMRKRYQFTSAINILSWALHGVFSGCQSLRQACFSYFVHGGDNVRVPMALLSGLQSSVGVLLLRYVDVMRHGACRLIFGPSDVERATAGEPFGDTTPHGSVYDVVPATATDAPASKEPSWCRLGLLTKAVRFLRFLMSPSRVSEAIGLLVCAVRIFVPLLFLEWFGWSRFFDSTERWW